MSNSLPISFNFLKKLYEIGKNSLCKFTIMDNNREKIGAGFFCELEYDGIPFKKGLFTSNHILNEENIKIGNKISFELNEYKNEIIISKDRKVFTDKEIDYTVIEIFENFNEIFKVEKETSFINNKECYLLSFPQGKELSFSYGIIKLNPQALLHTCNSGNGAGGSPLIIFNENKFLVVGIHRGYIKEKNIKIATKMSLILEDIKKKCK